MRHRDTVVVHCQSELARTCSPPVGAAPHDISPPHQVLTFPASHGIPYLSGKQSLANVYHGRRIGTLTPAPQNNTRGLPAHGHQLTRHGLPNPRVQNPPRVAPATLNHPMASNRASSRGDVTRHSRRSGPSSPTVHPYRLGCALGATLRRGHGQSGAIRPGAHRGLP